MIASVGATTSTAATGFVAQSFGFTVGFLALAIVAALGLASVWWMMPETVDAARAEE
jgi:predicted MFS family arabinose efflux permease